MAHREREPDGGGGETPFGGDVETPLAGGHLSRVVRVGNTVRRPTGHWTPAVHALLDYLETRDFPSPRVFGIDVQGREILSYLEGETVGAAEVWPAWTRSESTLSETGRLLRRYHDAVAGFVQPAGTRWRLTEERAAPGQIICHNDVSPTNLVHNRGRLSGIFDWDMASPGEPDFDLAFTAWATAPMDSDAYCARRGWNPAPDRPRRLALLVDAYGLERRSGFVARIIERITLSHDRIQQAAAAGEPAFVRLVASGVLEQLEGAREQVEREATALSRAIGA